MLRIILDLMYDNNDQKVIDDAIDAVCNIVETNLSQLQKEELFSQYGEAMEAVEKARALKVLTEEEIAAKNPTHCEGCEE